MEKIVIPQFHNTHIVVLMGGVSPERDISLKTGAAIANCLADHGYRISQVDVTTDLKWLDTLTQMNPDIVLLALHGKYGEDGCIQGLLETLDIPYTGSNVMASAIAMDKVLCSDIARHLGVTCTTQHVIHQDNPKSISHALSYPIFVKPVQEGSSINSGKACNHDEYSALLDKAFQSDNRVIAEEYVAGIEITVVSMNGNTLTPLEIVPSGGIYDYQSKYTEGMTDYILPARISAQAEKKARQFTTMLYDYIGCKGIARADFIVKNDDPYFLEINTMPGMTDLSLVPQAATYDGFCFLDVCEQLLMSANI